MPHAYRAIWENTVTDTAGIGAPVRPAGQGLKIFAYVIQFFFGGWFFFNGINYFVEFTPPPPGSAPGTRALMEALESTGLFAVVKFVELVTGAALLMNRFVPLATIVAFPVTLVITYVMLVINGGVVGTTVGILALAFNGFIALVRLDNFLPVLVYRDSGPHLPSAPLHSITGSAPSVSAHVGGLSKGLHAAAIIFGVGASYLIEVGTMAYFQSVARASIESEQGKGATAPMID